MDRRFSDREVQLILKRALDPEVGPHADDPSEGGLSLAEIEEIAAEVGIDPGRVRLAAATLHEATQAPANPYAGIPTTIQFQSSLPGVRLLGADPHDAISVIRAALGRQGIVKVQNDALEWRARDALGGRYVSITPSEDGVRVRVLGNFRDGLFLSAAAGGMLSFTGIFLSLTAMGLPESVVPLVAAGVALVTPRVVYRWLRRREDRALADAHARLVTMLGERATERAAEEAAGGAEALAPAGPTALPSTPGASASPPRGALRVIDLAEHFGRFEDRWTPKLVAEMNGQLVKLAKGEGDIVWHSHEHEDEFFLVVAGELTIHLRDGALTLGPGQCAVVPAGVEHRASAAVETHIVLIEPASTRHTGEVESEQTVSIEDQEWLL